MGSNAREIERGPARYDLIGRTVTSHEHGSEGEVLDAYDPPAGSFGRGVEVRVEFFVEVATGVTDRVVEWVDAGSLYWADGPLAESSHGGSYPGGAESS